MIFAKLFELVNEKGDDGAETASLVPSGLAKRRRRICASEGGFGFGVIRCTRRGQRPPWIAGLIGRAAHLSGSSNNESEIVFRKIQNGQLVTTQT